MTDQDFLRRAIESCRVGRAEGQAPFGAVVARDGRVLAEAHNTVARDNDPTAHAEINALRAVARSLGSTDLSGCTLYSTCEPCPMCLTAAQWARVDRVVFGASIGDAENAGLHQVPVSASELSERGGGLPRVEGGVLRDECVALFEGWSSTDR